MKMKKSEFRRELAKRCRRNPENPTVADDTAATLAEEAGVQWEPEEPELPKRIEHYVEFYLRPEGGKSGDEWRGGIYAEAAARYNAVGRIAKLINPRFPVRGIPQQDIVEILDEEGVTRG